MADVDPSRKFIPALHGTSSAIFTVSVITGALSLLVVALRTFVRLREKNFGWDDGFMLGGLCIFIVEVVLACLGAYSGLGTLDIELNTFMQMEAKKYLMLWMLLYVCSLAAIKTSICITMLRIGSPIKALRVSVYVLLALVVGSYLATFIGILNLCNPVEANWNYALVLKGKAKCASMDAMIGLSYFATASSIATDIACAVLPGVILWNMQLKLATKLSVSILLSFGSFASISTMIRTPYIRFYLNPTDNLVYHVGNIVLWSNIETTIGLVAGSLPSLRRLVKRRLDTFKSQSTEHISESNPSASRKSRKPFKNPTDTGVSTTSVHTRAKDGDWRRLHDDASDHKENVHGIRADYSYEVELSQSPVHSGVHHTLDAK